MFKLSQGKSGKFHFTLHAKNQQVVLTSEAYNTRAAALNGVASVKKNATSRESFETRTAKNGKSYFVLLAKNGEVIGQSQMYAHRSSAYTGIKSVMANAPTAKTATE
ncbi:MAG: YegP family protein [Aquincola sp.]|nr:YegP family protein [Aquincola sp.]